MGFTKYITDQIWSKGCSLLVPGLDKPGFYLILLMNVQILYYTT